MAKKKSGFGRFLGAITGTPYERLLKQVDKLVSEFEDDDRKLARNLNKLVTMVGQQYEEETSTKKNTISLLRRLRRLTLKVEHSVNCPMMRIPSMLVVFQTPQNSSEKSGQTSMT